MGYFRLLPEWYLKQLFKSQDYVMTYFHPRDFDAGQPLIPGLSRFRKFKSYVGIENASSKLSSLLCDETYSNLQQVTLESEVEL